MDWKEVCPGRFERPLDSVEVFLHRLAAQWAPLRREHWAVNVSAKLEFGPSLENHQMLLRDAWKSVRFHHPDAACTIEDDRKVYCTPSEEELESWMASTLIVKENTSAEDLAASIGPSPTPVLYLIPSKENLSVVQVLIHLSHVYLDGTGAFYLLQSICKAVAEPTTVIFGTESQNLAPSRDEAAGFQPNLEDFKVAKALIEGYNANLPSAGLPVEQSNMAPKGTYREAISRSPEETFSIEQSCKAASLSVTVAIHAVIIVAMQQLSLSSTTQRRYTSWGAFDVRPYIQPGYQRFNESPVSVYAAGLPITLAPSTFSEYATNLQKFYKQSLSPLRGVLPAYIRQFTTALDETPPLTDRPPATDPMLSKVVWG
ncbi:MAG: hypothetical protein LQ342_003133 [Letrouitia transgressa]|nr:MAG: hypothetical protein LQ342_003133 [Letrouitia transgressa]